MPIPESVGNHPARVSRAIASNLLISYSATCELGLRMTLWRIASSKLIVGAAGSGGSAGLVSSSTNRNGAHRRGRRAGDWEQSADCVP